MEWLDKIVWTQFAKSIGFFAIGIIATAITAYKAGFWQGYAAGLAKGTELMMSANETIDALAQEIMNLTREVQQLSLLIRSLSRQPYRQP